MAVDVHVRRLEKSWQYDFKIPGRPRIRKGGYRTKQAALIAGRAHMTKLESGVCEITVADAFEQYMAATKMKDRSRDAYNLHWRRIEPELGHYLVTEVDTMLLDRYKQTLPNHYSPQTINHHMTLLRAVLRFLWKRGKLSSVPWFPMESIPKKHQDWYTEEERDRLLDGMYRWHPQWYLFFYLTCRLGLRRGEVYGISHRQIRRNPPMLIVDQQVQTAKQSRPSKIVSRKNNEAYTIALTDDVIAAVDWHIAEGYAGKEYLFSKNGVFSRWLDGHMRSLRDVQNRMNLRQLGHHAIGRHSVASQAASNGESIKAIQAQLGHLSPESTHKYAHLASSAQLHVVTSLRPASAPHERTRCVNALSEKSSSLDFSGRVDEHCEASAVNLVSTSCGEG